MESFDLTYKLIALKIKSKTLDRIYFMSQVFQEHSHCWTKGKNMQIKTRKIYLFLLPLLPSQDGGLLQSPTHPPTQLFSWQKFLTKKFHKYMVIWTKGGKIDRMEILAKTQKWYDGKSEGLGGGGCCNNPPPLLRERVNTMTPIFWIISIKEKIQY